MSPILLVYLVILYLDNAGLFYIPIVTAVGIGSLEMGDIIKLKGPIGNVVEFMRKGSLSILGATANYITIQPVANVYVGQLSWATWILVLIFVAIVFVGFNNFKTKVSEVLKPKQKQPDSKDGGETRYRRR